MHKVSSESIAVALEEKASFSTYDYIHTRRYTHLYSLSLGYPSNDATAVWCRTLQSWYILTLKLLNSSIWKSKKKLLIIYRLIKWFWMVGQQMAQQLIEKCFKTEVVLCCSSKTLFGTKLHWGQNHFGSFIIDGSTTETMSHFIAKIFTISRKMPFHISSWITHYK